MSDTPRPGGSGAGVRRLHRTGGGVARAPILMVVLALLAVGGLVDRQAAPAAPAAAALAPVPVAAPANALSSSWFCAGATDSAGGLAPGRVVVANAGSTVLDGTVTLIPTKGPVVRVPVSVAPRSRRSVGEVVPGGTPWIGAVVKLDGGAAAVEQEIDSPLGESSDPCATSGSRQWYFAAGATRVNAGVEISLLNPYPTDAVVDLSFTTEQGVEQPQQFQGVVVPAGRLTTIGLGSHLRRRTEIATTIVARSGRVVAWKSDIVTPPAPGGAAADPPAPVAGVTVILGAPSPATLWTWPDGVAGDGIDERYVIYNPGPGTARVQLSLQLDQGSAEPFDLSVGPEQVTTVVAGQEARIPAGVAHAAVLRSTNGVPVVAERTVAATAPSPRTGLGELFGGRVAAEGWLLAAGRATAAYDQWVVLYNPGTEPVQASIAALAGASTSPMPGLASLAIDPGGRLAVRVNAHVPHVAAALEVLATGPVYAESDQYGTGSTPGVGLSLGVPLTQ